MKYVEVRPIQTLVCVTRRAIGTLKPKNEYVHTLTRYQVKKRIQRAFSLHTATAYWQHSLSYDTNVLLYW